MKAPLWGMCCAVVCSAIFGIAVALQVAGQLRAADSATVSTIGPDAPALVRPLDGAGNKLDYPNPANSQNSAPAARTSDNSVASANGLAPTRVQASPVPRMNFPLPAQSLAAPSNSASVLVPPRAISAAPGSTPVNGLRQSGIIPGSPGAQNPNVASPRGAGAANSYTNPTTAPAQLPASSFTIAPRQLETNAAQLAFDPQQATPIDGFNAGAPADTADSASNSADSSRNGWNNVQTAFRQSADGRPTAGDGNPGANSATMRSGTRPAPADGSIVAPGAQGNPTMRTDGVHPSTTGPMSNEMVGPDGGPANGMVPPDQSYGITPVIPRGDCGCGGGGGCGGLPPGQYNCPNCGGWQPGACSNHNPDGSCVLQRLACCLCKPYPDCSNGCVDFCHSWIHHEDDCWCTSNHKCCAPGCGPYPYGGCPNDGMGKGNGCGCGNCGPCVPPPDLYFSVEGFSLMRDNQTNRQDIVTSGGVAALNTGDFNFDWETGPRITLGYRPTKIDAWEITYFGLNSWDDRHTLTGAGDLSLPGDLGAAAGLNFGSASIMEVTYSSEIHSAEVNYIWHECGCKCETLSFIFGFRYFHLDEELNIDSTATGIGSSFYDTRTDNDLYGAQLGIRWKTHCRSFGWEAFAKGGAFGDSIVDRQVVANTDETPLRNVDFGQGHFAFVGELGVTASYHLCDCLEVMAGYNAIFVDGVALAPDQLDFTNTPTSGTMLDHSGRVFLHGAHAGIACRW